MDQPETDVQAQTSHAVTALAADPSLQLSTTGRGILEAARRLLANEGFGALSLAAVAKAAGESKSTVIYHFGDKAGLIAALTDSMIYDLSARLPRGSRRATSRRMRLKYVLNLQRRIARDSEYWGTLYDLLPHIVRDRRLRTRFSALMNAYYNEIFEALDVPLEDRQGETRILVSLILSVLEGCAMQRQILGPKGIDIDANFNLWELLLAPYLDDLDQRLAGRSAVLPDGPVD